MQIHDIDDARMTSTTYDRLQLLESSKRYHQLLTLSVIEQNGRLFGLACAAHSTDCAATEHGVLYTLSDL
jgi:hypothetical protein